MALKPALCHSVDYDTVPNRCWRMRCPSLILCRNSTRLWKSSRHGAHTRRGNLSSCRSRKSD